MMQFEHDPRADAVYVWLRPGVEQAFGLNLDDSRYIDYGEDNLPIGVEFLGVSQGVDLEDVPEAEAIAQLLAEHKVKIRPATARAS